MRKNPGDIIPARRLESILGVPVELPAPDKRWIHLQLRRFAGCPICNLHLRSFAQRHDELAAADVREVAVFHSTRETMLPFQGDLPFDVVADPEKSLYRELGVETSLRSVLHPAAWGSLLRGMAARHRSSAFVGEGGHLGLPADFLIEPSGRIAASKYGEHADDHWSVDELLSLVQRARGDRGRQGGA